MARPNLVNTYTDTAVGSVSVSVPDVQPGDTLIELFGNCYGPGTDVTPGGDGAGNRTPLGPQLGSPNGPNYQNFIVAAWRRVATASGTYTFTASYSSECMGIVMHFRGEANLDGDVSGTATAQGQSSGDQTIAGVAPSATDTLLVGVWGGVQFSGTIAYEPPSGMVERAEARTNSYVSLMCATQELTGAGSTGSRTATSSPAPANGWAGKLFALSGPADVEPPPPTTPAGLSVVETLANSGYNGTTSTTSVTTRSDTPAGAFLVAFVGGDYITTNGSLPTPGGTAGTWNPETVRTNDSGGANRPAAAAFSRTVTAAGAQTVSATLSGAGDSAVHLVVFVLVGQDGSAPVSGASSVYLSTDSAGAAAPSVTGKAGGILLCAWQSSYGASSTQANQGHTPPASMTGAVITPVADGSVLDAAREALTADGATGTRTAAKRSSTARPTRAVSVAVAPAPAATGPEPGRMLLAA